MAFCFYFCFVHIARKEDLLEYQQSGFPVNSSSKRRRISSQDSPDNYLSGSKALADEACAGGASTDLAEVIVVSTHKWSCSFLHRHVKDCKDQ